MGGLSKISEKQRDLSITKGSPLSLSVNENAVFGGAVLYVRQEDQIRFAKNRYRSDVFSGAHCADSAAVLPFFPDRFLSGKRQ